MHEGKTGYDHKIVLNVGGTRHETWLSTLERIPGSRLALLARMQEVDESYDFQEDEYFFDRNPLAFHSILHFYRSKELHVDHNVCGNVFREELIYWGLEEMDIEPCCWGVYSKYRSHKDTLAALDDNFMVPEEEAISENDSQWKIFQKKVWRLLEYPATSRMAKAITIVSFIFVAMSIALFIMETHYFFQVVELVNGTYVQATDPGTVDCCCKANGSKISTDDVLNFVSHPAIIHMDYVCIVFFSVEVIARIIFCPDKIKFLKQPLNVIDIVCLIPHYCTVILRATDQIHSPYIFLKVVMIMRIVRVLRIFKLMKHYTAFKILVYTIKVSTKELLLMLIFLFTGVLLFATIIYYAEADNFTSIPLGVWWALVTMTTVGYGDKVPKTVTGYLIGTVCVYFGVLVIAFTVPIVVNNFALYYTHAQSRTQAPSRFKKKSVQRTKLIDVAPASVHLPIDTLCSKTDDEVIKRNLNISHSRPLVKENDMNKAKPCSPDDNNFEVRRRQQRSSHRRSRSEPRPETPAKQLGAVNKEKLAGNYQEQTEILMKGLVMVDHLKTEERRRQMLKVQQRKEIMKKQKVEMTGGYI